MDKVKRLDENLKSRIQEQKNAKGRVQYKSAEDVQREIDRLQKQVDTGTMKIVDEKKALSEISQLNRQKKSFAGFDEAQKGIDDVKAQIAELKKSMDDPEARALSDRYTQIQTELDKIKAEQDEAFKGLNALRDERTKAHEQQQKAYTNVKEIKDRYYQSRRAAQDYEREARRVREEKRRAENDAYHRGKRQEVAKQKLEEANAPAYQDEIRTAQNLIAYFDPSSAQKQTAAGPGKFAATASRTVDDSGLKGTKLSKKTEDEDSYFIGGAGKKNKRNRNQQRESASTPTEGGKFNLDLGTIDSMGRIGVDPPMSQNDVPSVVEKLKEKLEHWKGDQKRKTEEVRHALPPFLPSLTVTDRVSYCRTLPKRKPKSTSSKPMRRSPTKVPRTRRASRPSTTRASMATRTPARRSSRRRRPMLMWRRRWRRRRLRTRRLRRVPLVACASSRMSWMSVETFAQPLRGS